MPRSGPSRVRAADRGSSRRSSRTSPTPAGRADDERLERAQNFGTVGNGGGNRSGDQAHAALWQIRLHRTNAPRDCSNAPTRLPVSGMSPAQAVSRPNRWRRRSPAGVIKKCGKSRYNPLRQEMPRDYFAFPAAVFLHSERNFLRSLPLSPLASASFEHSSEAAVRGFSAFFSAGAFASVLVASVLAGAVVCADAAPINRRETAVAVAREDIFVMGHLGLKQGANRCVAML